MQRNLADIPVIIFLYSGSEECNHGSRESNNPTSLTQTTYYVSMRGSLKFSYAYKSQTSAHSQDIDISNIPDNEGLIPELIKNKSSNTRLLSLDDRKKLTRLLENYHQSLLSTHACAHVIVEIFRKFYVLNEQAQKLVYDAALSCLNSVSLSLNQRYKEILHKIPNEIAEHFFEYVQRYLAVTARSKEFLSLLDFNISDERQRHVILSHDHDHNEDDNNEERQLLSILLDDVENNDDFNDDDSDNPAIVITHAMMLNLVNEPFMMDAARSMRRSPHPSAERHVQSGLKCVLEKILLPGIILACKYTNDSAFWVDDFIDYLDKTMGIMTDFKYRDTYLGKRRCINEILKLLEADFLCKIEFNMRVKRSDLAKDTFKIVNTVAKPKAAAPGISPAAESMANSSMRLFQQQDNPAPQPENKGSLRKSM